MTNVIRYAISKAWCMYLGLVAGLYASNPLGEYHWKGYLSSIYDHLYTLPMIILGFLLLGWMTDKIFGD